MIDGRAIAVVALGSALGGMCRFLIGQAFVQRFGAGFPYGTLAINVAGSFLIGIVAELATSRAFGMTPFARVFFATGVLGGFTTFSAFSLDAVYLLQDGAAFASALYVGASVAFSIAAAVCGQFLTRIVVR